MKKMKSLLMLLTIATASMTFVSCDDDPWHDDPWYDDGSGWNRPGYNDGDDSQGEVTTADEADALCGEWYGPVKYTYKKESGTGYDVAEFYANMKFFRYQANSVSGSGIETDYIYNDDGSVADKQLINFKWTILDNFDIKITFQNEDGTDGGVYILDANASQKGFTLGYDDKSKKTIFEGYMIGTGDVEGNEIYFNFDVVASSSNAKSRATASATNLLTTKMFGVNAEYPAITMSGQQRLVKNR